MNRELLEEALAAGRAAAPGRVASYIPELAKKDSGHLGAAVCGLDGSLLCAGDCREPFTIQSISKLITLALAVETRGREAVLQKVGLEPTGDAFNSMVRLDSLTNNKPFNPMINAGAIAVASCIPGEGLQARAALWLGYARRLLGNSTLEIDRAVFASEKRTGNKNRAMAYLMQSNGILTGRVEEHLELYFACCSLQADCRDLAYLGAVLASGGRDPRGGGALLPPDTVRLLRSLMVTCGLYDASGEYAATVGIPSKSGVGGGIVGAAIGHMGIGVYGPGLDARGNSSGGVAILRHLSNRLELSIF